MSDRPPRALKPRKSPRQARSKATVDAILGATIQVLIADGSARLTTTQVARRAGVSVGTMYQYFPHREALLYAVTQRYLSEVAEAVETAADSCRGQPLAEAADTLVRSYVDAKSARPEAALALYRVSGDMDVADLVNGFFNRIQTAAVRLLSSAPDASFDDIEKTAFTLVSAVSGGTRIVFENGGSPDMLRDFREQIRIMCRSYLNQAACASAVCDQSPIIMSQGAG